MFNQFFRGGHLSEHTVECHNLRCTKIISLRSRIIFYAKFGFWNGVINFGFKHHKNINVIFQENSQVHFFKFQSGFILWKVMVCSSAYKWCLEKKKPLMIKNKAFGALSTYPSKVFDCWSCDFFITKLHAHCVDSLNMLKNNWTKNNNKFDISRFIYSKGRFNCFSLEQRILQRRGY